MRFNLLLRDQGIDPAEVAVVLHTPKQRELRRWIASLVVDAPELFDAYQNNHGVRVEATLKARKVLASFVDDGQGAMLFAGLFKINGWAERTAAELDALPAQQALQSRFGTRNFVESAQDEGRESWSVFDLIKLPALDDVRGSLVIAYRPTQQYVRLAEKLDAEIIEIKHKAQFAPPVPEWQDFIVDATTLRNLHITWAQELARWRGVYLITEQAEGNRYVGSAYGEENLLSRWRRHVAKDKGVTAELAKLDPATFRFSILQLLKHDASEKEVRDAEDNWKERLHTREWGLNRN